MNFGKRDKKDEDGNGSHLFVSQTKNWSYVYTYVGRHAMLHCRPFCVPFSPVDSFANLDKSTVLQETRHFNDNIINNRKCVSVLTKVLYLINQVRMYLRMYVCMSMAEVSVIVHTNPACPISEDICARGLHNV